LKPSLAVTSPPRKRFLREARAAAAVRHDNIVTIHAVEDASIPYLVMEFVSGRSLQQKLDETGPLDLPEVLSIGHQIASGLAASHAAGLIHRDIKPSNIMLEDGLGRVKITDFGLARAADDATLTQSGFIIGTPQYMAPEQALSGTIDPRSDLFSLGSVLYTACSGRPPFRAPTTLAVLKRLTEDTPRPIREIIPETPERLCAIIAKLQAKDPAGRYSSAIEVANLLEQCQSDLSQYGALRSPVGSPSNAEPHGNEVIHALPEPGRRAVPWQRPTVLTGLIVLMVTSSLFFVLANMGRPFGGENRQRRAAREDASRERIVALLPAEKPIDRPPEAKVRNEVDVDKDWAAKVRALPESEQKRSITAKLKERNPGYKEEFAIDFEFENSELKSMKLWTTAVTDVSFLRAFPSLESLELGTWYARIGKLADLSPLRGLRLKHLDLSRNVIVDLTPLNGLPLESLCLMVNPVRDLRPLRNSPLKKLILWNTGIDDSSLPALNDIKTLRELNIGDGPKVTDLSLIKDLELEILCINITKISNISSLKGMPLTNFLMNQTRVEDLSPLKGMRLKHIGYAGSPVRDIEVLRGMPLEEVDCDFDPERDAKILRSISTLRTINGKPAVEFWTAFDSQQANAEPR
jgi:eukaryotic-like serine/threonine-protein kinase